jgi:hypothetical protein
MFDLLGSVVKAAAAVVTVPAAVVMDAVSLPSTAYNAMDPFGNTSRELDNFKQNLHDITAPNK